MRKAIILIGVILIGLPALAQVSVGEAEARLREREASRTTQPTTRPYDSDAKYRIALAASQKQIDALKAENAKLKDELAKAKKDPPPPQEVKPGMSLSLAQWVYHDHHWNTDPHKVSTAIAKVPVDIEVWTNPDVGGGSAVEVAPGTTGQGFGAPGQPEKVILVNDIVVYVSAK